VGLISASLNAVRLFFMMPGVPLMALVAIALNIFVVYGLVTNPDYFDEIAGTDFFEPFRRIR
jgi:hypothetical protein